MRWCIYENCVIKDDQGHVQENLRQSCCVAATEMSTAPRTNADVVVNILLSNSLRISSLEVAFPICVSHSLATTKIEFVELTKRFEVASGANVPPECETMITMASVKSSVFLEL